MANAQIGNVIDTVQIGSVTAKIADITADGANTFTCSATHARRFHIGQLIVFRVIATGAGFGTTARRVTGLTATVITYDGADLTLVAGTHGVYDGDAQAYAVNSTAKDDTQNLNGGFSSGNGFTDPDFSSINALRDALFVIDANAYSVVNLNSMTKNDLVFALRSARYATSTRGY